jgi:hypothetical protein
MSKMPSTPWHKVVRLRDDLRTGELSLSVFAADLYAVTVGEAKPVYQDPNEFFSLTYPTFNLRELAKDVILRLAGKNEKAVRQLELTYGGGKTHTLVTLYHLTHDPERLPDLPGVKEFIQHAGMEPPRARIAALCFDKIDVEKGIAVGDPRGSIRWLKQPWSVLAWQIAGSDGIRLLNADGLDEERTSAPAENLLTDLLSLPQREGLSTLILVDEVLTFAREKVNLDPTWLSRLQNFFQYLTQAVTKVQRCALVVSLLASDPLKSDKLGKEISKQLYDVFRRQQEEGVQPVLKEDVAEILRRRFFTADSIRARESFRPHVVAAVKAIATLDEQTAAEGRDAEDRYLRSYPFHPEMTEVLYSKWTQLEGFQRTRGVMRVFATALREAENWDDSPLVGPNVLLKAPGQDGLSEAARELTSIAAAEEYEGKKQDWAGILESELVKARAVQTSLPGLKHREAEQAVIATFIHSQPISQKALTRELFALLGASNPDKIELEKALKRWADTSWFLDEEALAEVSPGDAGGAGLPKAWRLGSKPNLTQMHSVARARVGSATVEAVLLDEIRKTKALTAGAASFGVRVHNLPPRPSDIEDDGAFHLAIVGPKAASSVGSPSAEARRYIDETTGEDRPRVYRNAVVLAVPSQDGMELARDKVRDHLAWVEVPNMLKGQEIDPVRAAKLQSNIEGTRKDIPNAIRQAYSIAVTVSAKNEVAAYRLNVGPENLFDSMRSNKDIRIQDAPINAGALLPGGPYELWREGETSRRVKDLAGAFAQLPHLKKMLRPRDILATLVDGAREGLFVMKVTRPDRSVRTVWREDPLEADLADPGVEVVLPGSATLSRIPPKSLVPGTLPGLWPESGGEVKASGVIEYFAGSRAIAVDKGGYEETVVIPHAEKDVVLASLAEAVKDGLLWLINGPASICQEQIPAGLLTDDATLLPPPQHVHVTSILPQQLPEAWASEVTTGIAISAALSKRARRNMPWPRVRDVISDTLNAGLLERTVDSGPWPCDLSGAQNVRLRVAKAEVPVPGPRVPDGRVRTAEAELTASQVQDLSDAMGDILGAASGYELLFALRVQLKGGDEIPREVVENVSKRLAKVAGGLKLV